MYFLILWKLWNPEELKSLRGNQAKHAWKNLSLMNMKAFCKCHTFFLLCDCGQNAEPWIMTGQWVIMRWITLQHSKSGRGFVRWSRVQITSSLTSYVALG